MIYNQLLSLSKLITGQVESATNSDKSSPQIIISVGASRENAVPGEIASDLSSDNAKIPMGLEAEFGLRFPLGQAGGDHYIDAGIGFNHQPFRGPAEEKTNRNRNAIIPRIGYIFDPLSNRFIRVLVQSSVAIGDNNCKPLDKSNYATDSTGESILGGDSNLPAGCVYDPKLGNPVTVGFEVGVRVAAGVEIDPFFTARSSSDGWQALMPSLYATAGHVWSLLKIGVPGSRNDLALNQTTDGFTGAVGLRWLIPTEGKAVLKPPEVIATIPADNKSGVNVGTKIEVTFDQPMDRISLGLAFILTDPQGRRVHGKTGMTLDHLSLIFWPDRPLQPGTQYTATVAGAKIPEGVPSEDVHRWAFQITSGPTESYVGAWVKNSKDIPMATAHRWAFQTLVVPASAPVPVIPPVVPPAPTVQKNKVVPLVVSKPTPPVKPAEVSVNTQVVPQPPTPNKYFTQLRNMLSQLESLDEQRKTLAKIEVAGEKELRKALEIKTQIQASLTELNRLGQEVNSVPEKDCEGIEYGDQRGKTAFKSHAMDLEDAATWVLHHINNYRYRAWLEKIFNTLSLIDDQMTLLRRIKSPGEEELRKAVEIKTQIQDIRFELVRLGTEVYSAPEQDFEAIKFEYGNEHGKMGFVNYEVDVGDNAREMLQIINNYIENIGK